MASITENPRISSFMAADHAEAVNGKLYVMGGGFDRLAPPTIPWDVRFSLAAVLLVPWKDTNRRFPLEASVTSVDGEELGWQLAGELEAGRAPGTRGADATIVIAAPVAFHIEEPTDFVLNFRFANDSRELRVTLAAPPPLAAGMPPPAG
jgi:hypothetical protein